jgi:phenylacetate-CoA ligase
MELASNFAHLRWPALPGHRGCAILAILHQLEQTQWWTEEQLLRRQFEQLDKLVSHAAATVPFYGERGLGRFREGGADRRMERWRKIPLLSRKEVQENQPQLTSRDVPKSHGEVTEMFTSGSTGRPLRSLRTQLFELLWAAFTVRDHLWHRRDLSAKLAVIRESGKGKAPYPEGSRSETWGWSSGAVFRTGPCVSLNVMTSTQQQAEWLSKQDPDYLLTHPSVVDRLARYCLERDLPLPRLRQVMTISEILRPATREACLSAWNAPVKDAYTAREVGYVALQCPDHDAYHIQSESALVELVDDSGAPCKPGDIGRVVVTPLHNFAMPLIRYDMGDRAEAGAPCACGRGLPVVKRILGREQNRLVMPGGEECWPLLSAEDLRRMISIAPIRRYQLVQRKPSSLELKVETEKPLDARQSDGLKAWVWKKFDPALEVSVLRVERLDPNPCGKFFDVIREEGPARSG